MRANITDAQQRSIISIVAKIPVAEARKPFLVELEKQLPKSGKVTDEALLASINAALKSFHPAHFAAMLKVLTPPSSTPSPCAKLRTYTHACVAKWALGAGRPSLRRHPNN